MLVEYLYQIYFTPNVVLDNVDITSNTTDTDTNTGGFIQNVWNFVLTGWNPAFVFGGVFILIVAVTALIHAACQRSQPRLSVQHTPKDVRSPFLSNYRMLPHIVSNS